MSTQYPIVQIAYFVNDIEAEAAHRAATFGAGPFYLVENIQLAWGEHRGKSCPFVHSSAYGQWGNIMLELVQQESQGPSPFRDLYPEGASGLHHVATMVDSLPEAYQHYADQGIPVATKAMTLTGTEFAFLDATAKYGHFIEVYERNESLLNFYTLIRQAAEGWRGDEPVRRFT